MENWGKRNMGMVGSTQTRTVDAHVDVPWKFTKYGLRDLSASPFSVDIPRMRQGGLDLPVMALYLSDGMQDQLGAEASGLAIHQQIRWLQRQKKEKGLQYLLALEGGRLLHEDTRNLEYYRELGIRYITITHNRNTAWADSATDQPLHEGLTFFGHCVVRTMNRLGILPDISHTSDDTACDVLDCSEGPVIASHSGNRACLVHPRNISIELAQQVARSGGFVGVPFVRRFIGDTRWDLARHIDSLVQAIGVEHVGIGSDLDGADLIQNADVSQWREIVSEDLDRMGYTSRELNLILGGNILRVLKKQDKFYPKESL